MGRQRRAALLVLVVSLVFHGIGLVGRSAAQQTSNSAHAGADELAAEPKADEDLGRVYREEIEPVLKEHCYRCHSPEKDPPESNLRLDTREGMLKGGDQGPAIVPKEPEKSLLWQALRYEMDDLKMPPDRRLDDDFIDCVATWIRGGAPVK